MRGEGHNRRLERGVSELSNLSRNLVAKRRTSTIFGAQRRALADCYP